MTKVIIKQDPEAEIAADVMAESIVSISQGVRALRSKSRLNDKALLLLIQHASPATGNPPTRPTQKDIKAVLDGIESLERTYLKKAPKP